jgi:hypothetical protein
MSAIVLSAVFSAPWLVAIALVSALGRATDSVPRSSGDLARERLWAT